MSGETLLLVDDDRLVLSSLVEGLQGAGYRVATEESAEDVIDFCSAQTPDLAVIDIRLPGISGIELARWLKENTDIPFLFLSAYADTELVQNAAEYGAFGYLVKPVDTAQAIAAIEAALARAREVQNLKRSEAGLTSALVANRHISTAIGILMERHRLSNLEAFDTMRQMARSRRQKLAEIASDIVNAVEQLNLEP